MKHGDRRKKLTGHFVRPESRCHPICLRQRIYGGSEMIAIRPERLLPASRCDLAIHKNAESRLTAQEMPVFRCARQRRSDRRQ